MKEYRVTLYNGTKVVGKYIVAAANEWTAEYKAVSRYGGKVTDTVIEEV
jgi:hypothetical protein